jgi:hypothetical protein
MPIIVTHEKALDKEEVPFVVISIIKEKWMS